MIKQPLIKGLTLIEMMFFLMLVTALAYVSFIHMKPSLQFWRVGHVLAQTQDLVMGMQAYHSLYSNWPDQGNNCRNALDAVHDIPVPIMGTIERNSFGSEIRLSCTGSQTLTPMIITQEIPRRFLTYYQRWLYQVAVPEVIPEDPNAMVAINSRIPPPQATNPMYFAQAPFGRDVRLGVPEAQQQLTSLSASDGSAPPAPDSSFIVTLADLADSLEDNQAWVQKPDQCEYAEQIDIGVEPNALCLGVDESEFRVSGSYTFTGTARHRVNSLSFEPNNNSTNPSAPPIPVIRPQTSTIAFTGAIDVTRTLIITGVEKRVERCRILQTRRLLCADDEIFDGWRVTVDQSIDFRYDVSYRVTSASVPGGLSQDVDLRDKTFLASEVLEERGVEGYEDVIGDFVFDTLFISRSVNALLPRFIGGTLNDSGVEETIPSDLSSIGFVEHDSFFSNCSGSSDSSFSPLNFRQNLQAFVQCSQ